MKTLQEISKQDIGKTIMLTAKVTNIVQTKGPTIYKITDGLGNFALKRFSKGAPANIEIGDACAFTFKVSEFNGTLEGELQSYQPVANKEAVLADIERKRNSLFAVGSVSFLVKSNVTAKLKEEFETAAMLIKKAIASDRQILIRHHNDCDGYSSGVVLERAILPLIEQRHGKTDSYKYFARSVCRAPFYEYEDSLRDIVIASNTEARFGQQPPLVLIVDNGSTQQDLLGILQGKLYGLDFIVIDHHTFGGEDVISAEVLAHINPFLVGEDYNFTAGMLCTELAHIINPETDNIIFIAAMAGILDYTASDELDQFIELAKAEGYDKETLTRMGQVIEYVARMLRNQEGREVVADLFGQNKERQRQLVDLLYPIVMEKFDKNLQLAKTFGKQETYGTLLVQWLDIEQVLARDSYPPAGRTTGIYHDSGHNNDPAKRVITLGHMSDGITMRLHNCGFGVHDIIGHLHTVAPNAFVEGGGHDVAGSIKFVGVAKEEVLQKLREYFATKQ